MNKLLNIFSDNELLKVIPVRYDYRKRKKIVTYVPLSYTDKLTFDLASAGAGYIGNYSLCSFRMKGIGTFLPGTKANPFSGRKSKLSFEEEIRLEMECDEKDTDNVVNMLISSHPYEEPAYEIYEFEKRDKNPADFVIELRKKKNINSIIKKYNKYLRLDVPLKRKMVKTLYVTSRKIDNKIKQKAASYNTEAIISLE